MSQLIVYKDWTCEVVLRRYLEDKSIRLDLIDAGDGEPVACATVCLAGEYAPPTEGHIYVKMWSENEGVLEALVLAQIVKDTRHRLSVGRYDARAAICKLLLPPPPPAGSKSML